MTSRLILESEERHDNKRPQLCQAILRVNKRIESVDGSSSIQEDVSLDFLRFVL